MDDQPDRVAARRNEIVTVTSGMLAVDVNLIKGMRRVCAKQFEVA